MLFLRDWIRVLAVTFLSVSSAQAGTWIVDQNGGPGVHFTDIPPAIAAAVPGDVILVGAGTYTGFTLTEGLTILGTPGPLPGGTIIRCCVPSWSSVSLPAGETAVLADMNFDGNLRIGPSAGAVILDRIQTIFGFVVFDQCDDVRLHRHYGRSVDAFDSHFEIASSTLIGRNGDSGETALRLRQASQALVTRTSCIGGSAFDIPFGGMPGDGGDGGQGIWLFPPGVGQPVSTLLLAGGGVGTIQGGGGGFGYLGTDGADGDALYNDQSGVWRSGCTFIPGSHTGSGALPVRYVAGPGSFDTTISPDDPTLELVGTPSLGGSSQLEIHAPPGTAVRLSFGRSPMILFTPGIRVERLVTQDYNFFLGSVPPSGLITFPVGFWSRYPVGTALYAQASVIDVSGGETRRTNSVPLIVR